MIYGTRISMLIGTSPSHLVTIDLMAPSPDTGGWIGHRFRSSNVIVSTLFMRALIAYIRPTSIRSWRRSV
jgi:hypothetical protein